MVRAIDWGAYLSPVHGCNLPWELLIEKAHVEVFICKGDQEDAANNLSTLKNIQFARDSGVPVIGCYYWYFPGMSAQFQIDLYSRAIEREKPDFIAVDIEDHQVNGVEKDPFRLSEGAKFTCAGLKERFPELCLFPYTRADFVSQFAPDMAKWLPDYAKFEWVAAWPDYGLRPYRLAWEEIASNHMFQAKSRRSRGGIPIDISDMGPKLPKGWNHWAIWQYSSRIQPPAADVVDTFFDHQYDWNLIQASLDEFKTLIGKGKTHILTDHDMLMILWNAHPELHPQTTSSRPG
jgi:hypothetical protein